jgi:hypothetical protein
MDGAAANYVAAVRRTLAFDPPLAARVAAEIEDHLSEALADHPTETEAILTRFGPPEVVARGCAVAQAPHRLRASARLMLTTLLLIVLTMRLRGALLPEVRLDGWLFLAHLCDRYGLLVALVGALFSLWAAQKLAQGQPGNRWMTPRRLTEATALALLISCFGGLGLTIASLSLSPSWSASAPLLTTAAEALALTLLGFDLRRLRGYPGLCSADY